MTVKQLRDVLANHDDNMVVIVSTNSDYTEVDEVDIMVMEEKGGYYSFPYPYPDKPPSHIRLVSCLFLG